MVHSIWSDEEIRIVRIYMQTQIENDLLSPAWDRFFRACRYHIIDSIFQLTTEDEGCTNAAVILFTIASENKRLVDSMPSSA